MGCAGVGGSRQARRHRTGVPDKTAAQRFAWPAAGLGLGESNYKRPIPPHPSLSPFSTLGAFLNEKRSTFPMIGKGKAIYSSEYFHFILFCRRKARYEKYAHREQITCIGTPAELKSRRFEVPGGCLAAVFQCSSDWMI